MKNIPKVTFNWNICSGKGTCVEVCPTSVFELHEIKEHPETLKAVPVRMDECILCMKCVPNYIEDSITIKKNAEN